MLEFNFSEFNCSEFAISEEAKFKIQWNCSTRRVVVTFETVITMCNNFSASGEK